VCLPCPRGRPLKEAAPAAECGQALALAWPVAPKLCNGAADIKHPGQQGVTATLGPW